MLIFSSKPSTIRSPTPSSAAAGFRVPTLATSVLQRAVARQSIDWPEKVQEVYLQHCNDYEPPSSVRQATDKAHKAEKETTKRRQQEAWDAYLTKQAEEAEQAQQAEAQPETSNEAKRKRTDSQAEGDAVSEVASKRRKNDNVTPPSAPAAASNAKQQEAEVKRDRENTTVLVDNLPIDILQTKLRQFFREYGHLNSITALVQNEATQTSTALIEFKTAEEAQSALLKNGKFMDQNQLRVESGHSLTLYVTNYPPAADEAYIRNLFKDVGEILSIRLPSLKFNAHRRFCYVSFRDRDGAAKATKKDGKMLEGKFKLVAKYSDPGQKKKRDGALAEGREVHIQNLDPQVPESELKEVFSKYGKVTRVNIPQNMRGNSKGFAFMDFETKEQAAKAVEELNNTKFRNRIIQVDLSRESKVKLTAKTINHRESASPAPSSAKDAEGDEAMADAGEKDKPSGAEIVARTVVLLGLPETVNDARVRALVEPLGTMIRLALKPANGGAQIEYADEATAGKAALKLDGLEFEEGVKLRTGTIEELRLAKSVHKDDRIQYGSKPEPSKPSKLMAPPTVRRPAQKIGGPKRGLGFVASKKSTEGGAKTEPSTNGTAAPKSNAEFKAMFLASGDKGKEATDKGDKPTKGEEVKEAQDANEVQATENGV